MSVSITLGDDYMKISRECIHCLAREAVEKSKNIMYIADNAGEIIFDKFLLENLPVNKVTYVVKGGPIVNDATMHDAMSTGIVDLVKVIDNGHSAQGTILKDCSSTFKSEFNKADLIIIKYTII
jgi:damage-control phosphatase, subfamily I